MDLSKFSEVMELSKEFKEGAEAFIKGKMPSQNPYRHTYLETQYDEWLDGWEESFYSDNYRKEN